MLGRMARTEVVFFHFRFGFSLGALGGVVSSSAWVSESTGMSKSPRIGWESGSRSETGVIVSTWVRWPSWPLGHCRRVAVRTDREVEAAGGRARRNVARVLAHFGFSTCDSFLFPIRWIEVRYKSEMFQLMWHHDHMATRFIALA